MYNVVGTQKIRLDDTILLRTQNKNMFNLIDKTILTILRPKYFFIWRPECQSLCEDLPFPPNKEILPENGSVMYLRYYHGAKTKTPRRRDTGTETNKDTLISTRIQTAK